VRTKTQLALVGEACSDDADCDDPCHTGVSCDTGGSGQCVGTPVMDGTACDTNSDLCDGQVCGGGICGSGTPVDCPDGDPNDCTFPTCAPSTGTCTNVENEPEDTLCSDGNACTIGDACNASGSC